MGAESGSIVSRQTKLTDLQQRLFKAFEDQKCRPVYQPIVSGEAITFFIEYSALSKRIFDLRRANGLQGAPSLVDMVPFFKEYLGPHDYCYSFGIRVYYWINAEENWLLEIGTTGWLVWTRPKHGAWVDLTDTQMAENSEAAKAVWKRFLARFEEKLTSFPGTPV